MMMGLWWWNLAGATTYQASTAYVRKLRNEVSHVYSWLCHCYIRVQVACHLRSGISNVYDVRIKCSLTTFILVDADLSYMFLHTSFGTIPNVCNWCTKNIATVNIQTESNDYWRPREGENATVQRSIIGLLTLLGLLCLGVGYCFRKSPSNEGLRRILNVLFDTMFRLRHGNSLYDTSSAGPVECWSRRISIPPPRPVCLLYPTSSNTPVLQCHLYLLGYST